MSRPSEPRTIAIIYGFSEGKLTGRALRGELEKRGFQVIRDARKANIVIAHSGGCFMVPPDTRAKLVLLVGISYWPKRWWIISVSKKLALEIQHFRQEYTFGQWLRKFAVNAWYSANVFQNIRMLRAWKFCGDIWKLPAATTVAIRNHDDVFCTDNLSSLPFQENISFLELPGQHDDLWLQPKQYVDIVQSYI